MRRFKNAVILLLAASSVICSQSRISVYSETDSTEYYIGDYIHYRILLEYDEGLTIEIPSVQDSLAVLDFIEAGTPRIERSGGRTREVREYIFSKYDSSIVTLPSFVIAYSVPGETSERFIATNPVEITVKTLEVNPEADIQDVKSPLRIPLDIWSILMFAALIAALAAAAYFVYRRYKSKGKAEEKTKQTVTVPPYKIALRKLMELEEKKLWQKGKVKDYHSEITEIVRRYFEERFRFIALEMPSSEVLNYLEGIDDAREIVGTTGKFLTNADLVKFAKFQPMPSVNEEMMKQAVEIVEKTKNTIESSEDEARHV